MRAGLAPPPPPMLAPDKRLPSPPPIAMLLGGAAIVERVMEAMYFLGDTNMITAVTRPQTNPASISCRVWRKTDRKIENSVIGSFPGGKSGLIAQGGLAQKRCFVRHRLRQDLNGLEDERQGDPRVYNILLSEVSVLNH